MTRLLLLSLQRRESEWTRARAALVLSRKSAVKEEQSKTPPARPACVRAPRLCQPDKNLEASVRDIAPRCASTRMRPLACNPQCSRASIRLPATPEQNSSFALSDRRSLEASAFRTEP